MVRRCSNRVACKTKDQYTLPGTVLRVRLMYSYSWRGHVSHVHGYILVCIC